MVVLLVVEVVLVLVVVVEVVVLVVVGGGGVVVVVVGHVPMSMHGILIVPGEQGSAGNTCSQHSFTGGSPMKQLLVMATQNPFWQS